MPSESGSRTASRKNGLPFPSADQRATTRTTAVHTPMPNNRRMPDALSCLKKLQVSKSPDLAIARITASEVVQMSTSRMPNCKGAFDRSRGLAESSPVFTFWSE